DDLTDQGAFGIIKVRLLDAVANWVFNNWLDIREVLKRVADLGYWASRPVWHQQVELPPVLRIVEHKQGWGRVPEGELPEVRQVYKIGRG
ncbi:unnamed protein product, partial [marine sediment metagenome]